MTRSRTAPDVQEYWRAKWSQREKRHQAWAKPSEGSISPPTKGGEMQGQLEKVLLSSNKLHTLNCVLSQKPLDITGNFCFLHKIPLYFSKGFTAAPELVPTARAFCLLWVSHLNLKLAAEEAVSSCSSFTFSVQFSSTDFSPVCPESPLLDKELQSTESLLVLKLFSGKFFDPPCYTLWILSRSAALFFEGRNWSAQNMQGCPGSYTPPTLTHAAPRKSQACQKEILQSCHEDSNFYHLIKLKAKNQIIICRFYFLTSCCCCCLFTCKYGNISMEWSVSGFEMWSPLTSFEVLWTARHAQTTCWVTLLFSAAANSQTGVEGTKPVWLKVPSSAQVTAQEFPVHIQNHLHTSWCSFLMLQLTRVCPGGVQCFRSCRGWEANPRAMGFGLNWFWPPRHSMRDMAKPWETSCLGFQGKYQQTATIFSQ